MASAYVLKNLRPQHSIMLQLAYAGFTNKAIAEHTGYSQIAISCILRSPAARAEIARMQSKGVDKVIDLPIKHILKKELQEAAIEGVRINRALQRDPLVKPETRAKIGQHFMDRVVFDKRDASDEGKESYRDLLRKLDQMDAKIPVPELKRIEDVNETIEVPASEVTDTTSCSGTTISHIEPQPPELHLVKGGKRIIDIPNEEDD